MKVSEETVRALFAAIDDRQNEFVANLKEAVAIPSVSGDPNRRQDCVNMKLEDVKVSVQVIEAGKQKLHDGRVIDLPPILFGVLGTDPKKKTLLIYGHLDVQPAAKELTRGDEMFGQGLLLDDKGPAIAWIHAISVLQKKGVDIPVNLKFVFECMEESGSEGLEQALRTHKDNFLKGVDMTCISDNYWLGKNKPCLTYGLRGVCYYFIEVRCAKQDLHSGTYGGSIPEAMNDLVWVMSQLADVDGRIKVPGIYDLVAPLTAAEKKIYETIDFCMDTFQADVSACGLLKKDKTEILMNRWRNPSLSLHGIEGAFSCPGAKTVIPSKVIGKFSIRIVPNMTPEAVDRLVVTYLNDLWSKRNSPNHFKCAIFTYYTISIILDKVRRKFSAFPHHSGMPWVTDVKHQNFAAGARAIKRVFGVDPDYTREGGSIPITLVFQELTG
ncbi:peptidase dimerization domain protein [Cooperia oncophora]